MVKHRLVVYSLLGVTVIIVLKWLATHSFNLQKEVVAALITGFATVVVSVVAVVVGKRIEKNRDNELKLRDKKVDVYERFIIGMLDQWAWPHSKDPEAWGGNDPQRVRENTPKLICWGSDKVIRSFAQLKQEQFKQEVSQQPPSDEHKQFINRLLTMEDTLRAIRADLGNSNERLNRGDLIQVFTLVDVTKSEESNKKSGV